MTKPTKYRILPEKIFLSTGPFFLLETALISLCQAGSFVEIGRNFLTLGLSALVPCFAGWSPFLAEREFFLNFLEISWDGNFFESGSYSKE